jgi:hypothetical protein
MTKLALPNIATIDLIAIAVILLVLCFWLVTLRAEARLKKALQKQSDNSLYESQFKCVLFSAGDQACKSAIAFQTKPLLIKNAPNLPLQGCNAKKCACSLLQHDDRRSGKDRRDLEILDKRRKSIYANKRQLKDRRRDSIREFLLPKYRSFS